MLSGFPQGVFVTNSHLSRYRYGRRIRRAFLFGALRTHSLMAREEMAEMVSPLSAEALLLQLESELNSQIKLIPGSHKSQFRKRPYLPFFRKKIGRIALFHLAWLYANQNIDESDLLHAKTIYDWCEKKYGLENFPQMALLDLCLLSIRNSNLDLAQRALAARSSKLEPLANLQPKSLKMKAALGLPEALNIFLGFGVDLSLKRDFLQADVSNPFRGKDWQQVIDKQATKDWLANLSKAILPRSASPLAFSSKPRVSPFDSLTSADVSPSKLVGPKVTVVMSAYRPSENLLSAAKSVLSSTYANLELLVIDDNSGSEFEAILARTAELDPRVRVLKQQQNGGTYRIRNRALDEASGELVTFNDSDDWMHPQRLERQVESLLRSKAIGNISMSTRLTDNLEAAESIRRLRIGLCEPSLLFWKDQVVKKIGYFDSVRKGGDSEYRRRLERAFGQDLEVVEPYRCLTIQRADNGGLTQGDLGFRWIVDFRLNYRDSYNYFQNKSKDLYVPKDGSRQFYAPRPICFPRSQQKEVLKFDLVIGANGHDPANSSYFVKLTEEAIAAGKKVGFWQIASMYPFANPRTLRPGILELLNQGKLQSVYSSDQLEVSELLLIAPSSFLNSYYPLGYNWKIHSRRRLSLQEAPERWQAAGIGLESLVDARFNQLG